MVIDGSTPGTGNNHYSQTQAKPGPINLTAATLNITLGPDFTPSVPTSFTIVDNTGSLAVAGTFNGLKQGSTIEVSGTTFQINYNGELERQLDRADRRCFPDRDHPARLTNDCRFRAICRSHCERERAVGRSDPHRLGRVLQRHNLAGDRNAF